MAIRVITLICFLSLFTFISTAIGQENQIVAGAGPSTEICKLFFNKLNKLEGVEDYKFNVMESSVKHKGGLLNSEKYIFGRTGRPLTDKEKALNKEEIFLAKVPITFSKGLEVGIDSLTIDEVTKIYKKEIVNWTEVGGPDAPILLVGREPTEALFMTLKQEYPFFNEVAFDKVFKKDNDVMFFLSSPDGRYAIAFGAKPNFESYNIFNVEGFSSGVSVGLVYDLKNENSEIVQLAKQYSSSEDWKNEVAKTSMLNIK